MNEYDSNNLKFIMNSTASELADWLKQADQDDIDYALELIDQSINELKLESLDLKEQMNGLGDLSDANNIIKKIMGK